MFLELKTSFYAYFQSYLSLYVSLNGVFKINSSQCIIFAKMTQSNVYGDPGVICCGVFLSRTVSIELQTKSKVQELNVTDRSLLMTNLM